MKLPYDLIEPIISGRRQDGWGRVARCGLRGLESCYRGIVGLRNASFDRGWRTVTRVDAPLVSIGNLTVGGTGKTPLTSWMVGLLQEMQYRPGILSRGYGSRGDEPNDEYRELALRRPQVPHVQHPDRVAAAHRLLQHDVDVIVLDDGFQHRRLHRDLDIVLLDCLNPFGYDHLIPRGLLREPHGSLQRADLVVLTRADQVSLADRKKIEQRVRETHPELPIASARFLPDHLLVASSPCRELPLAELRDRRVLAFCGIGNARGFSDQVERLVGRTVPLIRYPDHHLYSTDDVRQIVGRADQVEADWIVCTVKDWVKVATDWPASDSRLAALVIETEFLTGVEELRALLSDSIRRRGL